jgi:ferric-dicitrate binding protein FerR (iron transport regulator)
MNLSDGTKVWLNGGSSLTTTSNYGLADRSVSLTGEAYFEVSENKRLPFIVTTDQIRIRVLGTEFNISAYPDQELVETTLKEGRIELSPVKKGTFRGFIMRSNEIAIFNRMTSDMQRTKVDVETKIAWKNNQLIMENENYVKVFKKLENWYGVNFRFVNAPANEPDYSMTIKTETLSEILGLISLITPLEYEIKGEDILITYK